MKKIVKGLKRILIFVGTFFVSIYSKVVGVGMFEPMYGVVEPEKIGQPISIVILKIVRNFIIPIVFLIGAIVYLKKSSSSTLRKIITIIISLSVVVLICLGINYIINLI